MTSGLRQTEPLQLEQPFGWSIAQARNTDAARKAAFDGGFDKAGRGTRHRDRHVGLTNAAFVTDGKAMSSTRSVPKTITSRQARPRAVI